MKPSTFLFALLAISTPTVSFAAGLSVVTDSTRQDTVAWANGNPIRIVDVDYPSQLWPHSWEAQELELQFSDYIAERLLVAEAHRNHAAEIRRYATDVSAYAKYALYEVAKSRIIQGRWPEDIPAEFLVRHFEVPSSVPNTLCILMVSKTSHEEAFRLEMRLRQGLQFETAAANYNDDRELRRNAGNLGCKRLDEYAPEIQAIVKDLGSATRSKIVRTKTGYSILYVASKQVGKDLGQNERERIAREKLDALGTFARVRLLYEYYADKNGLFIASAAIRSFLNSPDPANTGKVAFIYGGHQHRMPALFLQSISVFSHQQEKLISRVVEREIITIEATRLGLANQIETQAKIRKFTNWVALKALLGEQSGFSDPIQSPLSLNKAGPTISEQRFFVDVPDERVMGAVAGVRLNRAGFKAWVERSYAFGRQENEQAPNQYGENQLANLRKILRSKVAENCKASPGVEAQSIFPSSNTNSAGLLVSSFIRKSLATPHIASCPERIHLDLTAGFSAVGYRSSNKTLAAARLAYAGRAISKWGESDAQSGLGPALNQLTAFVEKATRADLVHFLEDLGERTQDWQGALSLSRFIISRSDSALDDARALSAIGLFSDELLETWGASVPYRFVKLQFADEGFEGVETFMATKVDDEVVIGRRPLPYSGVYYYSVGAGREFDSSQVAPLAVWVKAYLGGFDTCRVPVFTEGVWRRICSDDQNFNKLSIQ